MAAGGATLLQDSRGDNFKIKVEATEQNDEVTSVTISDEVYFNELKYEAKRLSDKEKHTFWVEISWKGYAKPKTYTVSIINKDDLITLSKTKSKPKNKHTESSSGSSRFQSFKAYIVAKLNEPCSPPKNNKELEKDVQQFNKKTKKLDAHKHPEYKSQQNSAGNNNAAHGLDSNSNGIEKSDETTQTPPADKTELLQYMEILKTYGLEIDFLTFKTQISTHEKWETWKHKLLEAIASEEELDLSVPIEISTVLHQNRNREYDPEIAYKEFTDFASRYAQFVSPSDFTTMADNHAEWKTAFENFRLQELSSAISKETEDFLIKKSFNHATQVCKQKVEDICLHQFSVVVLGDEGIQNKLFTMRGYSDFLLSLEGVSFLRKCRKIEAVKSN